MPQLFTGSLGNSEEKGFVYVAIPPLYERKTGNKSQWVYSDEEKDKILINNKENNQKTEIQRYKGLGEMNANQLWETTMNPENRTLLKVTLGELKSPDKVFSDLMGDDVEPRRNFILNKAQFATNLDI